MDSVVLMLRDVMIENFQAGAWLYQVVTDLLFVSNCFEINSNLFEVTHLLHSKTPSMHEWPYVL
jgi:hypothetical protein